MKETTDIVAAWQQARQEGSDALLATVVQVSGSTYRRAGARMLLTPSGWVAGSVSGGCLEGDILQKAWWRTQHGTPALVTYDSTDEDDIVWGFGLGCNGVVQVLLERLVPNDPLNMVDFLARCLEHRRAGVVATAIRTDCGPAVTLGQRVLLSAAETVTSIGDPGLARDILRDAQRVLTEGQSDTRTYAYSAGAVDVAFESVLPPPPLIIFGAGHDAVPLARFAKDLGWHVTVVDTHSVSAKAQRFSLADCVLSCAPEDILSHIHLDVRTAAVVMTHSFPQDSVLLPLLLTSPAAYIGILGPKKRTARLLDELAARGTAVTEEALARLHGPIGLDIGADTPEQIALAIVAEVQAVLAGRMGGELRRREAPIYDTTTPRESVRV